MSEQSFSRRSTDNSPDDIARRALEIAVETKTMFLQHQKTCDEDRIDRREQIKALHISVITAKEEVQKVINRGMAWLILILTGCMGYFITTFGLPGAHHP